MTQKIVVATGNPGKLKEIREILADTNFEIIGLDQFDTIEEPIEDGQTFADNAKLKALYYAYHTNCWCLADDSGLVVDALNGAPGVHSARYAADRCDQNSPREIIDQANNVKLIENLENISQENRTARFVCYLALAKPGEIIAETQGTIEGQIILNYQGENGFGYDPLFYVSQLGKTTAQLDAAEKNKISHRGKAVRLLAEKLKHLK